MSTEKSFEFEKRSNAAKYRVAVYDYGVKRDILRQLTGQGCDVTVFPAKTPASDILAQKFDGVLLSNGPGDPEPVTYAQENIRHLIGKVPIFGICLGHQLLGLALGGRTYKLKFGHRGGNHPVKDLRNGRVEITAQNHGFSVDPDSLRENDVEFTHINLNDQTLEGFRHRNEPVVRGAVPPRSRPGPARLVLSLQRFREDDGRVEALGQALGPRPWEQSTQTPRAWSRPGAFQAPISSFHSFGCASMNSRIISNARRVLHDFELHPRERSRSLRP